MYKVIASTNNEASVWKLNIDDFDKWEGIQNFLLDQMSIGSEKVYVTAQKDNEDLFMESWKMHEPIDSYFLMNAIRGRIIDKVEALHGLR
jgi:hypothetical protein